jgi:hypothetical protein
MWVVVLALVLIVTNAAWALAYRRENILANKWRHFVARTFHDGLIKRSVQ